MDTDGPRKRAPGTTGGIAPVPNQRDGDGRSPNPDQLWRNSNIPVSYRTAAGGPRWLTDDNNTVVFSSTIPRQAEQPANPRCPSVCFSEEELQSFHKPWSRALVVKVLERSFAFPTIKCRLETLWAKHGQIQVTDASNAFFILRFSDPNDYQLAAFRGPWKIYDYYITVARWSPEFDETAPIRKILTWVRLPKLLIHYFNNVAVSRIGNYIGRTVRLDLATEEGARGRFARLCVEVDISKPLLGKYMIKDRLFYIEYESLDNICTQCGFYGHKIDQCPELVEKPAKAPIVTEDVMETTTAEGDFGAWMTVTHRKHGRRNRQEIPPPKSDAGSGFRLLRRGEVIGDVPLNQEEESEARKSITTQKTTFKSQPKLSKSKTATVPSQPQIHLLSTDVEAPNSTTIIKPNELISIPVTYENTRFENSTNKISFLAKDSHKKKPISKKSRTQLRPDPTTATNQSAIKLGHTPHLPSEVTNDDNETNETAHIGTTSEPNDFEGRPPDTRC
ncbi:hypothetical protein LINGRAPRIM_LOCUS3351 [Linum grandiflorum]